MRKLASILNSVMVDTVENGVIGQMPVIQACNLTDSPIEAQFMMHVTRYDFVVGLLQDLTLEEAKELAAANPSRVHVFPQVWIGDFRPDFLFIRNGECLAVEADGKDWHYDSERQIAKDNLRLATFAKRRVFAMRFLGREIWAECQVAISHVREFFDMAG